MSEAVLYVHGKGGSAAESEHYAALFPDCAVLGLDDKTFTPWETGPELRAMAEEVAGNYDRLTLIANSIGAFFSMHARLDALVRRAFFISPIVDMERLIGDMLGWAGVTEAELKAKGEIPTAFGETLSWDYLCYVRAHPIRWSAPTAILYGSADNLTSPDTVRAFARRHGAALTVMPGGEHWFHTPEQLRFLDDWIKEATK